MTERVPWASGRLGRRAPLLALLGLALAVRLANLWTMSELPVAEYQRSWANSDMALAYAWSSQILAGDVLCRDAVHPYTRWMQRIAPLETWEAWWGGKSVFYQAPLYAYALAAMRLVAGDGFWGIALCQAVLGVANVWLVFLLAERFFDRRAALVAGLCAALYGPALLNETLLLRDSLGVTCALALVWTLARATEPRPAPWLLAGSCWAMNVLVRETTLAFAPFIVLWAVQRFAGRPARLAIAVGAFLTGASLGLAPLVVRNLAVGVAPWALSTRGAETFVFGHAPGPPVGLRITPAMQSILERSEGRLGRAVPLTVALWEGDWAAIARHELEKLRAIVSRYEGMDNVNWYYFAQRSPLLRWSIPFALVLALGAVGVCAPGRRGDDRILRYFLLSSLVGLMYAPVVARYRLVLAAVLTVYAGAAGAQIVGDAARREWKRAALQLAGVATILLASAVALREFDTHGRWRAAEFQLAAETYLERGEIERALDELREGLRTADGPHELRLGADYANLARMLVGLARRHGRKAEATEELTLLVRRYPADPDLPKLLDALVAIEGPG